MEEESSRQPDADSGETRPPDPADTSGAERPEPGSPEWEALTPAQRAGITRSRNIAARKAATNGNPGSPATEGQEQAQGQTFRIRAAQANPAALAKDRAKPLPQPMAKGDAMSAAIGTTEVISLVGRIVAGDERAAMTDQEQKKIAAPLSRIYEKNAAAAIAVSKWADPIALLTAVAAWGARAAGVRAMRGMGDYSPPEYMAAPAAWPGDTQAPPQPPQAAPQPPQAAEPIPDGGRDNSSVWRTMQIMERR